MVNHCRIFNLLQPECPRLETSMLVDEGKMSGPRMIPIVYLYDKAEDVGCWKFVDGIIRWPVSNCLGSNELYR